MSEMIVQTPVDVEKELPALTAWARSLKVTTALEFNDAAERLKSIKGAMKRVVDFFKPTKQAQDEAKRRILEAEKKLLTPLEEAEGYAKRAMLTYQQEQQQIAQEEQRKLQAAADLAARKERERLQKLSDAAKKPETQQKYAEAAAEVSAPVVHVPTAAPVVAGITTKKVWKYRVTDAALVPREFLMVNDKALAGYARAMKGAVPVAGVEFYSEDAMASGRY